MAKYTFFQGQVTVEDGVYSPMLGDNKQTLRGVLILAQRLQDLIRPEATTQEKEPEDVEKEENR